MTLSVEDFDLAFAEVLSHCAANPDWSFERKQCGQVIVYVVMVDGLEAGRCIIAPPGGTIEQVQVSATATALHRNYEESMRQHGNEEHLYTDELARHLVFEDVHDAVFEVLRGRHAQATQEWEDFWQAGLRLPDECAQPSMNAKPQPVSNDVNGTVDEPWKTIPEVGWNRKAVELVWRGNNARQIGKAVSASPKTVNNRLSELRAIYGREVVPGLRDMRQH